MRNVCGLNVHKDNVFMCILKENGDKIEEKFGVLTPEHIFYFKCRKYAEVIFFVYLT